MSGVMVMVNYLRKDGQTPVQDRETVPSVTIPCTIWANQSRDNAAWLIAHGIALCEEYEHRYNKIHSCYYTLVDALFMFPSGHAS